ncbi:MAG: DUF4249 family protein [Bacteroidia bacterium]
MKTPFFLLLGLWTLAFAGCEQIIDPNDKNFEPEIFVYGLVGPGELPKIFLTETQSNQGWLEQASEFGYPRGLDVTVLVNGQTQTLIEKEGLNTFYNYAIQGMDTSYTVFYEGDMPLPDSGSYQLSLQYQGKEIKATTQIPAMIVLDSAYNEVIQYEEGGYSWQENVILVAFTDKVGSSEGYRVQFGYSGFLRQPSFDSSGQFIGFLDTTFIKKSDFSRTISDQGIDGQKMEIAIVPYINMIPQTETLPDGSQRQYYTVWVILETQSKALTSFQLSAEDQSSAYADPFVEPIFLKSNIEGGLGVFGAYQRSDTVWIKYYRW